MSDSETLIAQVDRMLNDRRTGRFCDNFPSQWLQLDRLITAIPDPEKFPYFYYHGYRTSMHMMHEPLLLFETVFVEDRSIIDLLAADFTWQSNMLRQNYEGTSESGHEVQIQVFRRVPIDDPRRGGVITNAAVMTMTATPTRTQPITRGAWLNEVIFNDPPEPPPADVPPLPEADQEELAKLTIRERLAAHRQRADCAGCHNRIDPLGFALENYGPTGVWRDEYENSRDVDVSGRLFNQYDFSTLVEFKALLVQEKQRFIRAFAAHLLSYALGRQLGPADGPALDEITAGAMKGGDQMRTILKAVATTAPPHSEASSTVSLIEPPVVTTSSTARMRSPSPIENPLRSSIRPSTLSLNMALAPRPAATSCPMTIPPTAGEITVSIFPCPAPGKGLAGQIGELDTYSAGYVRILEYKSTLKVNGTVATGGQAEVPL